MDLVLHLGAHATDGGRIAGWLSENAETLSAQGLVLPAPRRFLALISRALAEHGQDGPASPAREAALLAELGIDDARRRLVVSAPGLLGPASQVIAPEGFYIKDVARRVYGLRVLFPRARLRFLLAVRRADGFLPALLSHLPPEAGDTLLPYLDDDVLPWSLLVETLRRHAPAAPLTVWRHEDLPKVWPQVLEALTGADAQVPVSGMTGLAVTGLSAEGRLRASRYLATNPPPDPVALQRVIAAFGARFGFDAAPQTDQAVPGWAQQHVRRLARSYETEWADIASQSGVAALG
ncbi:MAG: Hairy Orange [Rhodobacteraceae bacterium HLUCCA12]|nr:MAG: Hairy Orange [Rhodobacteraceae bacterium HLUCCA12]